MNKPFLKTGYAGLLVLAISITLLFIFPVKSPKLTEGFTSPIMAFEFIQTKDEVIQMFSLSDEASRTEMIKAMDLGNKLDFIYMCLYTFFLLLFSRTCAVITKKSFFYLGALLSIAVLAGDILENIQLLGITSKLGTGDFETELSLLKIFTWIKWGGLGLIFLVLSPWFFRGALFSKITGTIGIISFALGVAAFFHRSVLNEIFSLSVALVFVLMIGFCFLYNTET